MTARTPACRHRPGAMRVPPDHWIVRRAPRPTRGAVCLRRREDHGRALGEAIPGHDHRLDLGGGYERRVPDGAERSCEAKGRAIVDSHRFDVAVRALATHASRRETLRGAAALAAAAMLALLRSGPAEAHHARIPLGGACRHTIQCVHHAPTSRRVRPSRQAVYCADNGFRYDGSLNCCRSGGGSCTRNAHCCGARHCRSGVCAYLR
jgi:hypothetical protein